MKKMIALLLALALSLSLCACGEKTQTVEITMDNWQEYFEIRPLVYWWKDDFGDITMVSHTYVFCIREEYAERIKLKKTDLTVGYTVTNALTEYTVDWENRTLELGPVIDPEETAFTQSDTFTINADWIKQLQEDDSEYEPNELYRFFPWSGLQKSEEESGSNMVTVDAENGIQLPYMGAAIGAEITKIKGTIEIRE